MSHEVFQFIHIHVLEAIIFNHARLKEGQQTLAVKSLTRLILLTYQLFISQMPSTKKREDPFSIALTITFYVAISHYLK